MNFIVLFPYLIKEYDIMFIIALKVVIGRRGGTSFSFISALLLPIFTPLFLPSSSVSLSYSILAVVWGNTRA